MHVLAINGSPRRQGNTAALLGTVTEQLAAAGIGSETLELAGTSLRGCTACMSCWQRQDRRCILEDDPLNSLLEKIFTADGLLLGSPTYFGDITAELKALIDRSGMVARANGQLLSRKVGAGVVAVRRAGSLHALATLQNFFLINDMVVTGSSYWNLGIGREPGEVTADAEGMAAMERLGDNLAWLLRCLVGH